MADNVINMFGTDSTPAPAAGEEVKTKEILHEEFKFRVAEYFKLLASQIEDGSYDFEKLIIVDCINPDVGDDQEFSINASCFGVMTSLEMVGMLEHAKFVAMGQSMLED